MARHVNLGGRTIKVPWSALDRAIEYLDPVRGGKRLQARVGHEISASWGGYNGASTSRRSLSAWNPVASDANADTLLDLPTLRARARDLERNSAVGGGAIATTVTHTVGTGLTMQSVIDAEALGLDEDQAEAWQKDTQRKFELWAKGTDSDITRTQNFYAQQDLVLRNVCASGDMLTLLTQSDVATSPIRLALQHIEADRLCNKDRVPDSPTLVAGVEMNDNGAPINYHVASGNPIRRSSGDARRPLTWTVVPAFGATTKRRNVLHIFERKRIGQSRGVPMLAPVIEPLKQLERYTEAELMAAVVSGLFTVFISSSGGGSAIQPNALSNSDPSTVAGAPGSWDGELGNGLVVDLTPGDKIESANPGRPNAEFDPFVQAIIRQVGLRLEIPFEVLVKHYTASYSAARAALLDAWRFFRGRRDWLATVFCQPVYEAWLDEAVAIGWVKAPGYFSDPLRRMAWCSTQWVGDGPGSIDPLKEVLAAKERVALTTSTLAAESVLHDGLPWESKVRQRGREEIELKANGLAPATGQLPVPGDPNLPLDDEQQAQPPTRTSHPAIGAAYAEAALVD